MSGLSRKAASGLSWMAVATGGQVVMQLIVVALLARFVTPSQFGIAGVGVLVVQFGQLLAESSIGPALIQRQELSRQHIRVAFTFSALSAALLWGLLAVTAPWIARFFGVPEAVPLLRALGVVFVIRNLTVGDFLMARDMRFRELGIIELTSYVLGYGAVAVTFAVNGAGAWAIVAGHIAQAAIRTVLVVARCRHSIMPSLSPQPLKSLLSYGGGQVLARIANFAGNQADNLVVGRFLGPAALGLYGRAYQMMRLPSHMFGQVMSDVLFPAMAKVQGDRQKLSRAYMSAVSLTALIALPASVIAGLLAPELVEVLLGRRWLAASAAFAVMALGIMFSANSKLSDALARATGAVYRRAWRQAVYAAGIICGALAGKAFGITGVAVGVLVVNVANFLLMAHLSLALTDSSWRDFFAAHTPALIMTGGVLSAGWAAQWLLRRLDAGPLLTLAGTSLAAAAMILVTSRAAPRLSATRRLAATIESAQRFLGKRASAVVARVLGPAYAPVTTSTGGAG